MCNDILMDLDKLGGEVILVLFGLSVAFDTIDHTVFITRLKSRFCVGGTALSRFSSYLQNRSQSILVDDDISKPVMITHGMPQGSVRGICVALSVILLPTRPLENTIKT